MSAIDLEGSQFKSSTIQKTDNQTESQNTSQREIEMNACELFSLVRMQFVEVTEEMRMRRANDENNEERVRRLTTEKFELNRNREEEVTRLMKIIETQKQELLQQKKEFEQKINLEAESKSLQTMSIELSTKGIKSLKDEIMNLQLARSALEKKIADQEHLLQMQERSCSENDTRIIALEKGIQTTRSSCEEMNTQLEHLGRLVVKTDSMQRKLIQVNAHQKCQLSSRAANIVDLQTELTRTRAQLSLLQAAGKQEHDGLIVVTGVAEEKERVEKLMATQRHMEEDAERLQRKHQFVLSSLSESSAQLSLMQKQLDRSMEENAGYQLELDEALSTQQSDQQKLRHAEVHQRSVNAQLAQANEKLHRTREELTQANEPLAALKEENESLKRKFEELHSREQENLQNPIPFDRSTTEKLFFAKQTQTVAFMAAITASQTTQTDPLIEESQYKRARVDSSCDIQDGPLFDSSSTHFEDTVDIKRQVQTVMQRLLEVLVENINVDGLDTHTSASTIESVWNDPLQQNDSEQC